MKKHQWTNSAGETFELNVIPPFMEELLLEEVRQKYEPLTPPGFWLDLELPNGTTKREYYQHTDDTMTEVVFTDNATGIITGWRGANGETLRWQDGTTANERRAWAGYKTASLKQQAQITAESDKLFLDRMLCDGLNVTLSDEWVAEHKARFGESSNVKLAYILERVCPAQSDYADLIHKLTDIRQISSQKVKAIKGMFPKATESSPTGSGREKAG